MKRQEPAGPYRVVAHDSRDTGPSPLPAVTTSPGTTLGVRLHARPQRPARPGLEVAAVITAAAGAITLAAGAGARALPPFIIAGLAGFVSLRRWMTGPRRRHAQTTVELSHEPVVRRDSVSVYVEQPRLAGQSAISAALVCEEWCRATPASIARRRRVIDQMLVDEHVALAVAPWRSEAHFFVDRDAPPSFEGERYGVDWSIEVVLGYGDARFVFPFRVLPHPPSALDPLRDAPPERVLPVSASKPVRGLSLLLSENRAAAGYDFAAILQVPDRAKVAVQIVWRVKRTSFRDASSIAAVAPEEHVVWSQGLDVQPDGSVPLHATLPAVPVTYCGLLIAVEWLVRVRRFGEAESHELPFTVG